MSLKEDLSRNDIYIFFTFLEDDGIKDAGIAEKKLFSDLDSPLRDTKLPLGADVTVSKITIQDFDECTSQDHNDCSDQVSYFK